MRRFLPFLVATLALSGCGPAERPFTDNSKDPELYALEVKRIALNAVQTARRSREPADQIQTLVTELESLESNSRPVGSYKPIYDELLATAKPLLEDCKKANGKPANLTSRLDELKKIAEKLPGEVQQTDRK
jgi:hypothetical protein